VRTLDERCVRGIRPELERCREHLDASVGTVTALVPVLGYERSAEIAKEALVLKRPRPCQNADCDRLTLGRTSSGRLLREAVKGGGVWVFPRPRVGRQGSERRVSAPLPLTVVSQPCIAASTGPEPRIARTRFRL